MKIIDLLNRIANGEEVPSPIYHNSLYYDFEDGDYFNQKTIHWLFNDSDIETILNDEVEIIEEDKKIKKIPKKDKNGDIYLYSNEALEIIDKINEIIDYLDKEK